MPVKLSLSSPSLAQTFASMGTIASLRAFRQPVIRLWRNFSNEVYELRACIETYQLYKTASSAVDRKLTRTERAIEYMFTSPASPQVAPDVRSQGTAAATQRRAWQRAPRM